MSMTTGQSLNREQVLAQLKKQKSIKKRPVVRTISNSFKQDGDQAITEVTTTYSVTVVDAAGEMGALNKKHLLQKMTDSRITWVSTSAGWKMKHSLRSPDRRYVDGKRIPRPR